MDRCLDLARRGAGHVSPNPLVGAAVVSPDGTPLGEGWHARYGEAHAEVHAIRVAESAYGSEALREATLYVNLEPCSHVGKTPPCADLIVQKGIARVVIGMEDPFSEVSGRGIARMRAHGVDVVLGVREHACRRLNEAFTHHLRTGRPLVTLKIAQTLDGRIATASGDSRWVSGVAARTRVHRWRAALDAVLVGRGTAAQDDPALTVRHVEGRQPLRVVLDRPGSLPPSLRLFTDNQAAHTLAVTAEDARPAYADGLEASGGRIWRVPERDGHLDLRVILDRLGRPDAIGDRAVQSVLVEAGTGLATALLAQDLADRLFVFVAPKLVGGGRPSLDDLPIDRMADAFTFAETTWEPVGEDMLFRGYRRAIE